MIWIQLSQLIDFHQIDNFNKQLFEIILLFIRKLEVFFQDFIADSIKKCDDFTWKSYKLLIELLIKLEKMMSVNNKISLRSFLNLIESFNINSNFTLLALCLGVMHLNLRNCSFKIFKEKSKLFFNFTYNNVCAPNSCAEFIRAYNGRAFVHHWGLYVGSVLGLSVETGVGSLGYMSARYVLALARLLMAVG